MNNTSLTRSLACPKCGTIVKCEGDSGEKVNIICPKCNTPGFFQFPDVKQKKINGKLRQQLHFQFSLAGLLILILSYFFLEKHGLFICLASLSFIPIIVFFHIDAKLPIIFSFIILIISAISLAIYDNVNFSNRIAFIAYWLLVVGTTCLLIEFFKDQKSSIRINTSG